MDAASSQVCRYFSVSIGTLVEIITLSGHGYILELSIETEVLGLKKGRDLLYTVTHDSNSKANYLKVTHTDHKD